MRSTPFDLDFHNNILLLKMSVKNHIKLTAWCKAWGGLAECWNNFWLGGGSVQRLRWRSVDDAKCSWDYFSCGKWIRLSCFVSIFRLGISIIICRSFLGEQSRTLCWNWQGSPELQVLKNNLFYLKRKKKSIVYLCKFYLCNSSKYQIYFTCM